MSETAGRLVIPMLLSLVGGLLLISGSAIVAFISLAAAMGGLLGVALLVLAMGTVVAAASILLYARPDEHQVWGLVIVVSSLLPLLWSSTAVFGFLSGFVLGMALALTGGILGVVGKPSLAAA